MENLWKIYGKSMENLWKIYGKSMEHYDVHDSIANYTNMMFDDV